MSYLQQQQQSPNYNQQPPTTYHHSQYQSNFQPSQQQQLQSSLFPITSVQSQHLQLDKLNVSRLNEHNIHYRTDKLYDPLRNTLFHPQNIKYHEKDIPQATKHSYLTQHYKVLTPLQAEKLTRNTFIPRDVDLAQTDHFYKVKDKQFVAVNTQTKVIGKAISPLQLQRIKQQGVKKSMVVYDLKERIQQVDPVTTYIPQPIETYGNRKQYKYNLYSIIDEPMNWIREVGCTGARWCVPNEVIAAKNQPQSMRWLK